MKIRSRPTWTTSDNYPGIRPSAVAGLDAHIASRDRCPGHGELSPLELLTMTDIKASTHKITHFTADRQRLLQNILHQAPHLHAEQGRYVLEHGGLPELKTE